ncbi:antA/AntB antirepressor family protein [Paraburkholderia phytofirmans]|uniref:antA/AntB antirepressor family protein n=1 Tax=Paraburkholderia phytofirmans TaxID=261302 RepID=UPI0038BAA78F
MFSDITNAPGVEWFFAKDFAEGTATVWLSYRLKQHSFRENQDFALLNKFVEQKIGRGGSNKKDYAVTMDMAKRLSMVEERRSANRLNTYFIETEKMSYELREPRQ